MCSVQFLSLLAGIVFYMSVQWATSVDYTVKKYTHERIPVLGMLGMLGPAQRDGATPPRGTTSSGCGSQP
jgi:hypothetical protein